METFNENKTLYCIELTQEEILTTERALRALSSKLAQSLRNLDRHELGEGRLRLRSKKEQRRAEVLAVLDKFTAVVSLPEVEPSNA